jgi:hypothetical protein
MSTNNLNDAGYTSTPTLNSTNNFTLGNLTYNPALSINDIIVFRIKYGTGVSGYISNIEISSDF